MVDERVGISVRVVRQHWPTEDAVEVTAPGRRQGCVDQRRELRVRPDAPCEDEPPRASASAGETPRARVRVAHAETAKRSAPHAAAQTHNLAAHAPHRLSSRTSAGRTVRPCTPTLAEPSTVNE